MRKDPSRHSEKSEMEMTPMIDVTFLLLIFFICTLKFKTLEGRLSAYLPKEAGVNIHDTIPVPEVEVKLVLRDEGTRLDARGESPWSGAAGTRFRFDEDRRIEYAVGPRRFANLGAVQARLGEVRREQPDYKAVLAPGVGIVHDEVVQVLDALLSSGFHEVRLQGAPREL